MINNRTATTIWADGFPQPLASTLVVLAMAWKQPYIIYSLHQKGNFLGRALAEPNLNEWLKYYQSESLFSGESLEYLEPLLPNSLDSSFFDSLHDENAQVPDDADLEVFYTNLIEGGTSKVLLDEDTHIFPLETLFFMLVWMPCAAIHGKEPCDLIKEARSGDLESMCDLIRIDRSVIFDSEVAEQIHQWALDFKNVHLKRIGEAFGKGPHKKSKKDFKLLFAQYVYDAARHANFPLTAPKVRELFNALAQDDGLGMEDPDLVKMTDDAFYRALTRTQKPLTKLSHPPKD